MSAPHKICPVCQTPTATQAPQCFNCNHQFSTQFPDQQTVMGGTQPAPPPPYQQPYQPPYQQPYQQPSYPPQFPSQNPYGPPAGYIQVPPGSHSAVTAMLLTLLLTGGGQMFNKQVGKGFVVLLGAIVLAMMTFGLSVLLTYPLAMADAYMVGARLNRGEVVGQWQCF